MDGFEGKVQYVWQAADLLRGDYKPAEYGGVISPLLVLLSDDEDVQQRAADNTEEQFSLTVKKDDIAGALFQNQESSNKLLKALLENEGFADAVQKIISTETWKAARRKHAESAA